MYQTYTKLFGKVLCTYDTIATLIVIRESREIPKHGRFEISNK